MDLLVKAAYAAVMENISRLLLASVETKRKFSQSGGYLSMGYSSYQINLPESPEAVTFINGFLARNLSGLLWMWKNVFWITNATAEAEGCVQVKAGICSPNEVVMVSYWQSEDSLKNFFRGKPHRQMMHYIAQHPASLCLYNETYRPHQSGKYIHEPQGLAIIYPQAANEEAAALIKVLR